MFTPDDAIAEEGPIPMPGDVVLIEDRKGCRHCTDFAPHWDRFQSVFTDSMFTIDAVNPPSHLRRFVSSAKGRVPTVMIVEDEEQQRADQSVSSALRKFIQKSNEKGHTDEQFIGNIGTLSERVADKNESRSLAMLHDTLENDLRITRAIARLSKRIGAPATTAPVASAEQTASATTAEKVDAFVVEDLQPPASSDVVTISAPVDKVPGAGLSSILDHLAIEDADSYGDTMY